MNDSVPWRMYSNSRRSTLPGRSGKPGPARSRAWTPVISSVLITRSPADTRFGASRYTPHTSAILSFRSSGGSSAAGVSQYRMRCGLRSASFEQPPSMARRDRCNDAASYDFVRQLTVAPLADRPVGVGRLLTSERDDLTHLLGRELRRSAALRCIRQPFGHTDFFKRHVFKLQPAPSPVAWRLVINAQFPSNLQVVQAVACGQHNPRSQGQLLACRKGAHQALQLRAFPLTQHHFRRFRRGHHSFRSNQDASSYPAVERVPAPFRRPVLGMAKFFGTGGHLPEQLRSAGVSPEDIDTVVFTHLHP